MTVDFKCNCGSRNHTTDPRVVKTTSKHLVLEVTCGNCMHTGKIKAYKDPTDYGVNVAIYSERK